MSPDPRPARRAAAWRLVWIAAAVSWFAFTWRLSATPGGTEHASYWTSLRNNAGHAVLFGIQATLIYFIASRGARGWSLAIVVVLACAVLGAVDEYHQSFVPNRSASAGDVLTDTCGALAAVSFWRACDGGGWAARWWFLAAAAAAALSAWAETPR